jgi:predicted component of type VI protein secretion system
MSRLVLACVALVLLISGCASSDEKYLSEQEALDAAWTALEPNTASHN